MKDAMALVTLQNARVIGVPEQADIVIVAERARAGSAEWRLSAEGL